MVTSWWAAGNKSVQQNHVKRQRDSLHIRLSGEMQNANQQQRQTGVTPFTFHHSSKIYTSGHQLNNTVCFVPLYQPKYTKEEPSVPFNMPLNSPNNFPHEQLQRHVKSCMPNKKNSIQMNMMNIRLGEALTCNWCSRANKFKTCHSRSITFV